MTEDLHYRSAGNLAQMIRERQVSSVEVVEAFLARIGSVNPVLNGVIEIAPESAAEQARAADRAIARGERVGPLHGVPFTVKDVYEVADAVRLIPAPGMASRPGPPATRDSTAVARLRDAGAILIGVSRATLWADREERYGPAHNPYDLGRTPGGSSGGEAATIAAGGSPLGMGSDSGGSLRWPAHFCGVAAIRPSNGRVPRSTDADGMYDLRTAAGPLARTVEDVALALRIVGGVDWADPATVPVPLDDWRAVRLSGMRVAVHSDNGLVPPTAATAAAVEAAAGALTEAGAVVDEVLPPDLDEAWEITLEYWRTCDGSGTLMDYFRFLDRWDRYRVVLNRFMRAHDVLLCPVEAFPAPLQSADDLPATFTYTAPFSLVGWPATVVRAGSSPEGLPIGVQVIAGPWRDEVALAVAATIESSSGGWQPPSTHLVGSADRH